MSKPASPLAAKPAAETSATTANNASTAASAASQKTSASRGSTPSAPSGLGPGPRRFRGDVPAFSPSTPLPHLYTQHVHPYAPQPPGLLPVFTARQPQYFAQQPQFVPYGGLVMQYYPVMAYPDFSMYQPYQYYAVPGQFQNQQAYMPMGGIPGGAANGYAPGRKKNFKAQNNHHHNHNNNNNHYNHYYHNSPAQSGQHHAHPKHPSPTAPPSGQETLRDTEVNNPELVPRIDDSATFTSTSATEPTSRKSTPLSDDEMSPEKVHEAPSPDACIKTDPGDTGPLSATTVANQSPFSEHTETSLPILLSITQDELIEGKHAMLQLGRQLFKAKTDRMEGFFADLDKDYYIDTQRRFQIIDHNRGSEYEKALGAGLPLGPSKANDNDTNDSKSSKPTLNWASLLQSTVKKPAKLKGQALVNGHPASPPLSSTAIVAPTLTDRSQSLGLLVMSMLYDPAFDIASYQPYSLKPRGLTNTGNICYMNAVLQCLIFCAPFNKTLRLVEEKSLGLMGNKTSTPVLDATIAFVNDFANVHSINKSSSTNSEGIVIGRPLSPEKLYTKLVESPKFQHLKWGQQEDAEEFLVYFLDGLHEDFVRAEATVTADQMEQLISLYGQNLDSTNAQDLKSKMKNAARLVKNAENPAADENEESPDEQNENGWSEVGGRRKVSSKRISEVEPSPITSIFGGRFRSVLTVPKSKESHSITVDPYRCILLDISLKDVETIEDALWKLNEIENLPYKTESGVEVVAQKQTYIEDLPEVLTLQLKRFSFQHKQEQPSENDPDAKETGFSHFHGVGKIEKVLKNVSYGLDLTIPIESLSPTARHTQSRTYLLTGVIYHHGRNAEGGHYTCDVLRDDKKWLRIDDTAVDPIDADAVIEKPEANDKSAYIFIYQRKRASHI